MEDSAIFASYIVLDIKPASNGHVMLICSPTLPLVSKTRRKLHFFRLFHYAVFPHGRTFIPNYFCELTF